MKGRDAIYLGGAHVKWGDIKNLKIPCEKLIKLNVCILDPPPVKMGGFILQIQFITYLWDVGKYSTNFLSVYEVVHAYFTLLNL